MRKITEEELEKFAKEKFITFFPEKITKKFLYELKKTFLSNELLLVNLVCFQLFF